jgi:hypothetical protein
LQPKWLFVNDDMRSEGGWKKSLDKTFGLCLTGSTESIEEEEWKSERSL